MMNALAHEHPTVTREEYFRYRERHEGKYELHDGRIVAMAGGTRSHSRLGGMAYRLIYNRVEDNGCEAFDSDQSVGIETSKNYYFPDASMVCESAVFDDKDNLLNPLLIVEVLSPSTALYDRNTKFDRYKEISSLQYYLLIWQDTPRLELFVRSENLETTDWNSTVIEGLDGELMLPMFSEPLPLADLYRTVKFENIP
jgi:Uma2 family endonuclease